MRYGNTTETTTLKCEGCGKRIDVADAYWIDPIVQDIMAAHTVFLKSSQPLGHSDLVTTCSIACFQAAKKQKTIRLRSLGVPERHI